MIFHAAISALSSRRFPSHPRLHSFLTSEIAGFRPGRIHWGTDILRAERSGAERLTQNILDTVREATG